MNLSEKWAVEYDSACLPAVFSITANTLTWSLIRDSYCPLRLKQIK